MAIRISDDKELVQEIRAKLAANKEQYGKQFCPCVLPPLYSSENNQDYVCMCKKFRDMEEGECHCGLYVKTK